MLGILLVYDVLVNKLNDNSTKLRIFHSFYGIFSTKKITIVLWVKCFIFNLHFVITMVDQNF